MKTSFAGYAICCLSLSLCSCATLLNSSKETALIYAPQGSSINVDGQKMETKESPDSLPISVDLQRDAELRFKVEHSGRSTGEIVSLPQVNYIWALLNLPTLPIGHVVDAATQSTLYHRNANIVFFPENKSVVADYESKEFQEQLRKISSAAELTELLRNNRAEVPAWTKALVGAAITAGGMAVSFSMDRDYSNGSFAPILLGISPLMGGVVVSGLGESQGEDGNIGNAIAGAYLGAVGGAFAGIVATAPFVVYQSPSAGLRQTIVVGIVGLAVASSAILSTVLYNASRSELHGAFPLGEGALISFNSNRRQWSCGIPMPAIQTIPALEPQLAVYLPLATVSLP